MKRSDIIITEVFRSQFQKELKAEHDCTDHTMGLEVKLNAEVVYFLWEHKVDKTESIPSVNMEMITYPLEHGLPFLEENFYFVRFMVKTSDPDAFDIPIFRSLVGIEAIPQDILIQ